jgi:telomerase reverse transcriptase
MFLISSQVLLRLIDDYLFITTSLTSAKRFLDMMKKGTYISLAQVYIFDVAFPGHPEYGCFISPDKTLTNFDHDDQLLNVVDPSQRSILCAEFSL